MESEQELMEEFKRVYPSKKAKRKYKGVTSDTKLFTEFKKKRATMKPLIKEFARGRLERIVRVEKKAEAITGGLAENLPPEIPELITEFGIDIPESLTRAEPPREVREVREVPDIREIPDI